MPPRDDEALVRASVAAARSALGVWTEAEKTKPIGFDDVVSGFGREGGAPPAAILEAVEEWLRAPSTKNRRAATATLDLTAQLRNSDEDMGDLFDRRWLYALASARCAAHALEVDALPADEASLAVVCALEAVAHGRELRLRCGARRSLRGHPRSAHRVATFTAPTRSARAPRTCRPR